MNYFSKRIFLVVVAIIFLATIPLNYQGYCFGQLRFLERQEIIDEFLLSYQGPVNQSEWKAFRQTLAAMTPKQKEERIKENREKYTGCCWLSEDYSPNRVSAIIRKILFGGFFYILDTRMPRQNSDNKMENAGYRLDACGRFAGIVYKEDDGVAIDDVAWRVCNPFPYARLAQPWNLCGADSALYCLSDYKASFVLWRRHW